MTPMTVPLPAQCSYKIQVTQRAQYLEVTAKVSVVPYQDRVSNSLNSYASGIGLSFLSLPHHIQQITGDIPSLPSPPPIDFDEPVYLIIATDGSLLFEVRYYGWVLVTKDEISLNHGGGPDDGIFNL
jgi:hypothetical protein